MSSIEIWKYVDDFFDYMVSSEGRVKNWVTGRVLRPYLSPSGYYEVNLYDAVGYTHIQVHRLVAHAFCPGYETGFQVDHVDGNKQHNASANLEWVSRGENARRAYELGLNHPLLKTNVRPVEIIETGEIFTSAAECARAINGRQSTIQKLVNGIGKQHKGYTFRYATTAGGRRAV